MSDNSFCNAWANYWRNYQGQPVGFNPPWYRVNYICRDLSGTEISIDDYKMRKKAEVLQYNKIQNNFTKKQRWAMLNRGELGNKKSNALQTFNYTNPNVNNYELVGNTLILSNSQGECNETKIVKTLSTASNVPGKPMYLYLDPNIPLIDNQYRWTFSSIGTKWPQTAWTQGNQGFPVGKSGTNPSTN